jgi:hypothetical protein
MRQLDELLDAFGSDGWALFEAIGSDSLPAVLQ